MARLIDFHTNCRCGGDVHAELHVDDGDELTGQVLALQVTTPGTSVVKRVALSDALLAPAETPTAETPRARARPAKAQPAGA